MSRCTTPAECAVASASAIWVRVAQTLGKGQPAVPHDMLQSLPGNVLHGDEMNALHFIDIVNDDDARMIERGCGLCLEDKAVPAFRIGNLLLGKDFYGHETVQMQIARFIDDCPCRPGQVSPISDNAGAFVRSCVPFPEMPRARNRWDPDGVHRRIAGRKFTIASFARNRGWSKNPAGVPLILQTTSGTRLDPGDHGRNPLLLSNPSGQIVGNTHSVRLCSLSIPD